MAIRRTQVGQRLTAFVFTLNNWTPDQYTQIRDFLENNCTWAIVGKEIGESGTPHLQGFALAKKQMAFNVCHKALFNAHIEAKSRNSTYQDQFNYCSKDGDYWQCGLQPIDKQGKRQDIIDAITLLNSPGGTMRLVAEEYADVYVKFHKGLIAYRSETQPPRDIGSPPTVYWLSGSTGTGKTRWAVEYGISKFTRDGVYIVASSILQWFDGYSGQPCIIVDDFRAKGVSFNFLLRFLDRYDLRVPTKGGYFPLSASTIIITTPHDIEKTFSTRLEHKPEDIKQLTRRITVQRDFDRHGYNGDLESDTFESSRRDPISTIPSSVTASNVDSTSKEIPGVGGLGMGSTTVQSGEGRVGGGPEELGRAAILERPNPFTVHAGVLAGHLRRQDATVSQCVSCLECVTWVNNRRLCWDCWRK